MLVFRIAVSKYADRLQASGRAARWNPNEVNIIYTSSSRSLASLENVVHRSQLGLNELFKVMTIKIDDQVRINSIKLNDLPADWKEFHSMPYTQAIGEKWVNEKTTAILAIPSSVIQEEVNYLLNPAHPDFKHINLINTCPFVFDHRIKI